MDSGNVEALRQGFFAELDLVDADLVPLPVMDKPRLDVFMQGVWQSEMQEFLEFKVHGDDVIPLNPLVNQMLPKERKEKMALATAADSRENLHETIVLGRDDTVQKVGAGYVHKLHPVEILADKSKKMSIDYRKEIAKSSNIAAEMPRL